VAARFEVDVQSATTGLFSCLLERENLGVLDAIITVGAGAGDSGICIHNDRTDAGIGRGQPNSVAGQVKRSAKKKFVSGGISH
jgi:hypothetical protein